MVRGHKFDGDIATGDRERGLFEASNPAPADDGRKGHRARLKARFRKGGADAVADYELLEMILFRVHLQKDTKPLAKELLRVFGSFAEVINAPETRLREIKGIGQSAITEFKLVRASALCMMKHNVIDRPLLASWDAVIEYCRAAMGFETREQFRILFLDKRNHVIGDEVQQVGTVDHTPVYIREVVRRALELSATAIILVHNHPSGDPEPSRADIAMTRQIVESARNLGIVVHDHIIIARDGHVSFKGRGLL